MIHHDAGMEALWPRGNLQWAKSGAALGRLSGNKTLVMISSGIWSTLYILGFTIIQKRGIYIKQQQSKNLHYTTSIMEGFWTLLKWLVTGAPCRLHTTTWDKPTGCYWMTLWSFAKMGFLSQQIAGDFNAQLVYIMTWWFVVALWRNHWGFTMVINHYSVMIIQMQMTSWALALRIGSVFFVQ